jgi:hypothetical protein
MEHIDELEEIKDRIIRFFENSDSSGTTVRSPWSNDVKEAYYYAVTSWELLKGFARGEAKYHESSREALEAARSRKAQVSSELKALESEESTTLEKGLTEVLEKVYRSIKEGLEDNGADMGTGLFESRVLKIGEGEYGLPCSVCGKIASTIKTGDINGEKTMVYSGIAHMTRVDTDYIEDIFRLLDEENLGGLNEYLQGHTLTDEGLDSYCPECDAVYCYDHFNVEEFWDAGFYDHIEDTCPRGHKRMITD